jgi:hypothetical protein
MGKGSVDIVSTNAPTALGDPSYNRVEKFLLSFLGATSNDTISKTVDLKIPFTIHAKELQALGVPDARIAGWGVFFSGICLVSLTLYLVLKG